MGLLDKNGDDNNKIPIYDEISKKAIYSVTKIAYSVYARETGVVITIQTHPNKY